MICYNITSLTDDPAGVKLMESSTRTLKAVLFPRSALRIFRDMDEARQAGAYILYHTADKHEQPQVYIGQSGTSCYDRLASHNRSKDFWNYAMVFVESQEYMNAAHVKTIESILIKRATECGVVVMDNDTGSKAPPMKTFDRMSAETWANEIIEICRLLGLSFFEKDRQDMVLTMEEKADVVQSVRSGHESARKSDSVDVVQQGNVTGIDVTYDGWGSGWCCSENDRVTSYVEAMVQACSDIYRMHADFEPKVCNYPFFSDMPDKPVFSDDLKDFDGRHYVNIAPDHDDDGVPDWGFWMCTDYSAKQAIYILDCLKDIFEGFDYKICIDGHGYWSEQSKSGNRISKCSVVDNSVDAIIRGNLPVKAGAKPVVWGFHGQGDERFLSGEIAIGWKEFGDMSGLLDDRDVFKKRYVSVYFDERKNAVALNAGMLYRFRYEVQIGNYVVFLSKSDRMVNIGKVVGEYTYTGSGEYPHSRKVEWIMHCPREQFSDAALNELGAAMTLFRIMNNADEFLEKIRDDNGTNNVNSETDMTTISVDGKVFWKGKITTAIEITIKLCEVCIKAYGFEVFRDKVVGYPFFPKARARVVFSMDENDMRGFSAHKFDGGLYMLTNYSGNSLTRIRKSILELFNRVSCDGMYAGDLHMEYWMAFHEYFRKDGRILGQFKLPRPHTYHYQDFHFGMSEGHVYIAQYLKSGSMRGQIHSGFYMKDGEGVFQKLFAHKDDIEKVIDCELVWDEKPNKTASTIYVCRNVDFGNHDEWDGQFAWFIDKMLKMKEAVTRYL